MQNISIGNSRRLKYVEVVVTGLSSVVVMDVRDENKLKVMACGVVYDFKGEHKNVEFHDIFQTEEAFAV